MWMMAEWWWPSPVSHLAVLYFIQHFLPARLTSGTANELRGKQSFKHQGTVGGRLVWEHTLCFAWVCHWNRPQPLCSLLIKRHVCKYHYALWQLFLYYPLQQNGSLYNKTTQTTSNIINSSNIHFKTQQREGKRGWMGRRNMKNKLMKRQMKFLKA